MDLDFTNACRYGHVEVVKLLLEAGVDPTSNNNKAIKYACGNGHVEVVKLLLKAGVNPSVSDDYPLRIACENGHLEVVKVLLEWRGPNGEFIDPSDGEISLGISCKNGHVEVVKVLLEWRGPNGEFVDPLANDNRPIQIAELNNHLEVVKVLLQDHRADPSFEDNRLIKYACRSGDIELVRLLLQDPRVDPSVGQPYFVDNVPLYEACIGGFTEIVRLLLRHIRVSIECLSNNLHTACYGRGGPELVLLLLQAGADPSFHDNLALKQACRDIGERVANPAVIRLLLSDPRVDPSVIDINIISNPAILLLFKIRREFSVYFQNLPETTVHERRKKEHLGQTLKRYRDILTDEQRNYLDSYNLVYDLRLLRKIMPSKMDDQIMKQEILRFISGKKSKNKKKYRKSKQ